MGPPLKTSPKQIGHTWATASVDGFVPFGYPLPFVTLGEQDALGGAIEAGGKSIHVVFGGFTGCST
jgi:hypothetical protein